ncbi:hypothetical protein HDV00_005071 [Rhizophlyctis rosea]|nr:hypothetical protein HDV00_005071 [Rhizophlyctis rosea]
MDLTAVDLTSDSIATSPLNLTSLNDDALLDILHWISPTDEYGNITGRWFHHLSHTCRRFHVILRNPQVILSLLRAAPPSHVIATLAVCPLWALPADGYILRSVLDGPKPPLLYVERFLVAARKHNSLMHAAFSLTAKCGEWYHLNWNDIADVLQYTVVEIPEEASEEPSMKRFLNLLPGLFLSRNNESLNQMLDVELFPLEEFFRALEYDTSLQELHEDTETEIFFHPKLKAALTLPDILPRIHTYLKRKESSFKVPKFWKGVMSLYHAAPSHHKHIFHKHLQSLLDKPTYRELEVNTVQTYRALSISFPHLIPNLPPTPRIKSIHLSHCIRTCNLPKICTLLSAGISPFDLIEDGHWIDKQCLSLEGWFLALAIIVRYPELGTGDVHRGGARERSSSHSFREIEEAIVAGSIPWVPSSSASRLKGWSTNVKEWPEEDTVDWKRCESASEYKMQERGADSDGDPCGDSKKDWRPYLWDFIEMQQLKTSTNVDTSSQRGVDDGGQMVGMLRDPEQIA